jgi:hypothetical protein
MKTNSRDGAVVRGRAIRLAVVAGCSRRSGLPYQYRAKQAICCCQRNSQFDSSIQRMAARVVSHRMFGP